MSVLNGVPSSSVLIDIVENTNEFAIHLHYYLKKPGPEYQNKFHHRKYVMIISKNFMLIDQ